MKQNIFHLMEQRGYKYIKMDGEKYFFIKTDDLYSKNNIICEVFSNNRFNLVYTNKEMCGILQTGILEDLDNGIKFISYEEQFSKLVGIIKKGLNIPWYE